MRPANPKTLGNGIREKKPAMESKPSPGYMCRQLAKRYTWRKKSTGLPSSKNFLSKSGVIYVTTENRPATEEDKQE